MRSAILAAESLPGGVAWHLYPRCLVLISVRGCMCRRRRSPCQGSSCLHQTTWRSVCHCRWCWQNAQCALARSSSSSSSNSHSWWSLVQCRSLHACTTTITAGCSLALCRPCNISNTTLHANERQWDIRQSARHAFAGMHRLQHDGACMLACM